MDPVLNPALRREWLVLVGAWGLLTTITAKATRVNGLPYLSIGFEAYENGHVVGCGCLRGAETWLPEAVRPCVKWHLATIGGPMHYEVNTLYWCGLTDPYTANPPNLDAAKSTCAWGALPTDTADFASLASNKATLTSALRTRLPALIAAFRADMLALFGEPWPEA